MLQLTCATGLEWWFGWCQNPWSLDMGSSHTDLEGDTADAGSSYHQKGEVFMDGQRHLSRTALMSTAYLSPRDEWTKSSVLGPLRITRLPRIRAAISLILWFGRKWSSWYTAVSNVAYPLIPKHLLHNYRCAYQPMKMVDSHPVVCQWYHKVSEIGR